VQKGASREIKPLSPQDHPDIAAALEVVDLEEGPARTIKMKPPTSPPQPRSISAVVVTVPAASTR
jgi:hypothetical protein